MAKSLRFIMAVLLAANGLIHLWLSASSGSPNWLLLGLFGVVYTGLGVWMGFTASRRPVLFGALACLIGGTLGFIGMVMSGAASPLGWALIATDLLTVLIGVYLLLAKRPATQP
ncbi:MAG: hypothetical protein MRY64_06990 [Hyphomonadaceae bacterium]|nr:hypothetical protein [Hyphomonadaceae bacterium]